MELAKVSLRILTELVNERLETSYDEPYISRVRSGKAGSPALRDIVIQEEAKLLRKAADAAQARAA